MNTPACAAGASTRAAHRPCRTRWPSTRPSRTRARRGTRRDSGPDGAAPESARVLAEGDHRRPAGRRRLAHDGERGVREDHADRRGDEADSVARGRRHRRQDARGREAAGEPARTRRQVREREEASARAAGDHPPDDVHPRRHEHAADAGDDEQRQQQHGSVSVGAVSARKNAARASTANGTRSQTV